ITDGVINMMTEFLNLVVIIAIMLSMNFKLALISMVTLPLLIGIGVTLRPRLHRLWHMTSARNSAITANLNESITGMKVTQAFSRQEKNLEQFTVLCKAHRDQWMKAIRLNMLFGPLSELSGAIGLICVFWFGVHEVQNGLQVGVLVAFTSYLGRFWGPISNLTAFYVQIQVAMASAERVFEFLDTEPEITDRAGAGEMKQVQGNVEIRDVEFSYDGDQTVLHGVSLQVQPGQTVAVVGPTGAGKSSIINLLCRFYDPTSGAVLIDGTDIRDVKLSSLRRQIGIVLQDTFIFPGTIEQNIRYGRLDATLEQIQAAAKAVQIHDMIESWSEGYQTEVEERGSKLSAGQRQLLAFARALLADPRILILDEATSSIDTETESHIQLALKTLLKGRTAFIIAHRMSTIRHADKIIVVDQGRIMEQGTHEELLDQKGIYYRLCRVQIREMLRGETKLNEEMYRVHEAHA
ncbi:MAG: multidrug transporter ATP-binding protein, partial [Bacilli bacterium]|nr:multidrug transporter ATP-binding protein [Bacilli bacterium]